jgi:threonine-phosphate decarboxylase
MRVPEAIATPVHGGNVTAVAARYDLDPASLLDFSANIDPFGPPPAVRAAIARIARAPREVASYPEPTAKPLREAIARHHGIDAASVLVANGSTALLDAIVRGLEPEATVIPVPAFSEYRRAIRSARSRFVAYPLDAEFEWNDVALLDRVAGERAKLLVLTNPHNPSGRLLPRERLAGLIEGCARRDACVVVDEAFIDYAFVESLVGLRAANLIVVRSLTKFYGMAGIRAGYAVAPVALAARIAGQIPSWADRQHRYRGGVCRARFGQLRSDDARSQSARTNALGSRPASVRHHRLCVGSKLSATRTSLRAGNARYA